MRIKVVVAIYGHNNHFNMRIKVVVMTKYGNNHFNMQNTTLIHKTTLIYWHHFRRLCLICYDFETFFWMKWIIGIKLNHVDNTPLSPSYNCAICWLCSLILLGTLAARYNMKEQFKCNEHFRKCTELPHDSRESKKSKKK